jgi:site-specific recombinase XerD
VTGEAAPGAAQLALVAGVSLLRPDAQVFEAILDGWGRQQASRNLATTTIVEAAKVVRRFQLHAGEFPWRWTPAHLEDWTADLRGIHGLAQSTIRSYQLKVRGFLRYVCDPVYGWDRECETRFGTHPVQICHDWNTAVHTAEVEAQPTRRALSRAELQALFDAADDEVAATVRRGRKGFAAAFRDATMLKVCYAFGLRRHELVYLDVADFGRNPKAPEFGDYGVCVVRYGKASRGSPPKRRGVLTVMPWSVPVLKQWVSEVWPLCRREASGALWPSERAARVSEQRFNRAFNRCADAAGLPEGLSPHGLRHSYVTHLVEDGFDGLFVQQQVGHVHASTTSIYTAVSSDYRTRVLRAALDRTLSDADASWAAGQRS